MPALYAPRDFNPADQGPSGDKGGADVPPDGGFRDVNDPIEVRMLFQNHPPGNVLFGCHCPQGTLEMWLLIK